MMHKKPLSANKKLLPSQKQLKKKVTVIKCFVCNQMFYSQETFDTHMNNHQNNISTNLPEEIKRKTLDSFGLKNKDSKQTTAFTKKGSVALSTLGRSENRTSLNRTMKVTGTKVQEYSKKGKQQNIKRPQTNSGLAKKQQQTKLSHTLTVPRPPQSAFKKNYEEDGKQLQEIKEALMQSSRLIQKMSSLTQKFIDHEQEEPQQIKNALQTHSDSEQEQNTAAITKTLSQQQFLAEINKENPSIVKVQQLFLKTDFVDSCFENYQIQLQYLQRLKKLKVQEYGGERLSKVKSRILTQVIKLAAEYDGEQKVQKSRAEIKIPTKLDINTEAQKRNYQQNTQIRNCVLCFSSIGFGDDCFVDGEEAYHRSCLQEEQS